MAHAVNAARGAMSVANRALRLFSTLRQHPIPQDIQAASQQFLHHVKQSPLQSAAQLIAAPSPSPRHHRHFSPFWRDVLERVLPRSSSLIGAPKSPFQTLPSARQGCQPLEPKFIETRLASPFLTSHGVVGPWMPSYQGAGGIRVLLSSKAQQATSLRVQLQPGSMCRPMESALFKRNYSGSSLGRNGRRLPTPGAKEKIRSQGIYLAALAVAMLGAAYAAVPLYRMFCAATGFGGTVQRRETVEEKVARQGQDTAPQKVRELVVYFNADVADGLPWKFVPSQREMRVRTGQSTLAFYTAHNLSSEPITGVSTYNVSPMKAGIYFNKIQCFCFEEQRLLPGEKIDMPVFFYIDPDFASDNKMKDVNTLTLSYTFFKSGDAPL